MGLSNEERLTRFSWAIIYWRHKMDRILQALPVDNEKSRAIVKDWIRDIDRITGKLVRELNTNGHYWILGSNSDSYKSLFDDHYDLAKIGKDDGLFDRKGMYRSLKYYEELGVDGFVHLLTEDKKGLPYIVALFWEGYNYIDSILYGVYRYDDHLIRNFEDDLICFFGRYCNQRFDLFCSVGYSMKKATEMEQVILCKHTLFRKIIEEKVRDHYRETSKDMDPEEREKMADSFYEGVFGEIDEIVKYMTESPLSVIQKDLEKRELDEWNEKNKFDRERHVDVEKKVDPIFGPKPRAKEELDRIIDNIENVTKEEYEAAREELVSCYSTYVCDYDIYMKKKNKEKAMKSVKKSVKKSKVKVGKQ